MHTHSHLNKVVSTKEYINTKMTVLAEANLAEAKKVKKVLFEVFLFILG